MTNKISPTESKTEIVNGKTAVGAKLRPYQFILNGELRVYDQLKVKFSSMIKQYYGKQKMDMVPAVEGMLLILRPKDENNKRGNFYDGSILQVVRYSEIKDIVQEIDQLLQQFEAWRMDNLRLKGQKIREFIDNMKQGDFRKLNNAMTFMTLISILSKPTVIPEPERMTIFYSGFSASNIRRGEWFNSRTLKLYHELGSNIFSKFSVTQIGNYSVVNSIADLECDSYEFKFNMNIAKEVYVWTESKQMKQKLTDISHFGSEVSDAVLAALNSSSSATSISNKNDNSDDEFSAF